MVAKIFLPQIIVTFLIKTADLTVKIIRPDIILKNTTHKKKLKYAPLSFLDLKNKNILPLHKNRFTFSQFFSNP